MEPEVDFPTSLPEKEQRRCFFCFEFINFSDRCSDSEIDAEVSSPSRSLGTGSRSFSALQNLFRYLGVDLKNLNEVNPETLLLCNSCEKILEKFTSHFWVWEVADMNLALMGVEPIMKRMQPQKSQTDYPDLLKLIKEKCKELKKSDK